MTPVQRPGSLSTRLLVAQIGVSVAMALTMVVVAAIAGSPLFEAHMQEAGHDNPELLGHSQEAFSTAGALALAMGHAIAATGAVVVSVLITRHLRRSLIDLGGAAARISEGDYNLRVGQSDSRELATLADSFNRMAGKLATVEGSRRRLLTDLAHEIRTPLASMEICVESLEDGAIKPGPDAWQILHSQIDRISRLADDLGQISAAEEGRLNLDPRPTDPNALAETAVLAAREGFERKQVEIQFHPYGGDGLVTEADPARIGQVLGNLLSNALRHTPSGGGVDLVVTRDGDHVILKVTDSGDGIAPEHLSRIFERFYRVDAARDREHGGTGVGLAISRAIARAHGGALSAASPGPGKGTTLTLRLPKAEGTPGKVHTAP